VARVVGAAKMSAWVICVAPAVTRIAASPTHPGSIGGVTCVPVGAAVPALSCTPTSCCRTVAWGAPLLPGPRYGIAGLAAL
jgi:hypothetical protein